MFQDDPGRPKLASKILADLLSLLKDELRIFRGDGTFSWNLMCDDCHSLDTHPSNVRFVNPPICQAVQCMYRSTSGTFSWNLMCDDCHSLDTHPSNVRFVNPPIFQVVQCMYRSTRRSGDW